MVPLRSIILHCIPSTKLHAKIVYAIHFIASEHIQEVKKLLQSTHLTVPAAKESLQAPNIAHENCACVA